MRLPVASEGLPFIVTGVVVTALFAWISTWLAGFAAFFTLFCVFFFRDPERVPPEGEGLVVSPADGTILSVSEVDEPHFINGRALRICIFMSITDVHVNRAPTAGKVVYRKYNPGRFELAWREKASELNEQLSIGIDTGAVRYLVTQIAGYVARRIVCRVDVDDQLFTGMRYGLIRFGSRVEVYFPSGGITVRVKAGDKVYGGTTVLGVLQ